MIPKLSRLYPIVALLAAVLMLAGFLLRQSQPGEELSEDDEQEMSAGRTSRTVEQDVINAPLAVPPTVPDAAGSAFTPQTRLGFSAGDQWEPAIAADRFGHVYVLYPQYSGVPGCGDCYSPTMILQTSSDRGTTWSAPRIMFPAGETTGQYDAQILVDPADGKTVYASWLQNSKSDTVVARSGDFGATWNVVTADHTNAGTDKPILLVRGQDVYVGFNHAQKVWVAASHNDGASFTAYVVNPNGKLGWSLAGGAAIDKLGNVYYSWAGYEQNGGAKGNVNLYVSKSGDGGKTWTSKVLDISGAPPDCSSYACGWAFLGAQIVMTADDNGTLYALWNAGTGDKAPERIWFSKSADAGSTWSAKRGISSAPEGTAHAFPAIVARGAGDVRIAWMDARAPGGRWNTYYRRSANSGASWSAETDISTPVSGIAYINNDGFAFPFGDYFKMDVDDQGKTQAVWGEGANYQGPGSIWYSRGQ